jgi:hypothetical protein
MPSSGGSISDNTVSDNNQYLASIKPDIAIQGGVKNYLGDQEVVNAPKHWKSGPGNPDTELAYITKAEKDLIVKKDIHGSLKDGENIGPAGVVSLDSAGDWAGSERYQSEGPQAPSGPDPGAGDDWRGQAQHTYTTPSTVSPADVQLAEESQQAQINTALEEAGLTSAEATKENFISKFKSGNLKASDLKFANSLGWLTDNAFVNAIGGTFGLAMSLGGKAQSKAINWELNRRLNKAKYGDKEWYDPEEQELLEEQIRRANLPKDDPEHYGQNEYTRDYPGPAKAPDRDGDNARGLTNIITPYAAHAIGGTTQQPSMAANWYANLGSGNTSPGAFNLTQQYAAAKASVSQRLKSTSSIGQIAVADSAFFNFLKDNSLNKGIL